MADEASQQGRRGTVVEIAFGQCDLEQLIVKISKASPGRTQEVL
ncbi:hypothetical protein [Mycobacterium paraseoulense]|nr:hypothetical protein [Mycobacterium paraseoulense]